MTVRESSLRNAPAILSAATCLFAGSLAGAQETPKITAEEAQRAAREFYSIAPRRTVIPCPRPTEGEIVVCADIVDPRTQAVPSDAENGVIEDHVPRAPDFRPPPCVPNLLTYCSKGLGPVRDPLIIDLEAIPEPPPGSDADRMAKGEIPAP